MNDMIVKNTKARGVYVRTFDLWEKFGYSEHRLLKKVITDNKDAFEEDGFLQLELQKPKGAKGGRPDESYLLNEQQFVTLVMLAKNTPEAKEFKLRIKREFFRMREQLQELAQHAKARLDGKVYRRKETDTIKTFIEMAKGQGASDGINNLYATLTTMENKALFVLEQTYPNIRDVLNTGQLMQVCVADQIVEKVYAEAIESNMHYKDAYKLAKARVHAYAEVVGKSPIMMLEEGNNGIIDWGKFRGLPLDEKQGAQQ